MTPLANSLTWTRHKLRALAAAIRQTAPSVSLIAYYLLR
jgi:hypothetical protein